MMEEQDVAFVLPLKKILQIMAVVLVLWLLTMGSFGLLKAIYYSSEIGNELNRMGDVVCC